MNTVVKKVKRDVDGILLLDKPKSISSNRALQRAKAIFKAKKAGHTGSLDPLATGALPICFGEATKLSQYSLNADKEYIVDAKLGARTETGDAEGEIVEQKPVPKLTEALLESILRKFRGPIMQTPSMYSAIKHQGQPLYKLARKGIDVERPSRSVTIYDLVLLDFTDTTLCARVRCSKGTYIRTLIEDIGQELGCGAYVTDLRRTSVGQFEATQLVTFEELEQAEGKGLSALDKFLLPLDSAVSDWPKVELAPAAAFYMEQGQATLVPFSPDEGMVRIYLKNGPFLGVGEMVDGRVAPRRLIKKR